MTTRLWMLVAMWMSLCVGTMAGAEPVPSDARALTIRIYDYADTEPTVLRRAQDQAGKAFGEVGVNIIWREAVRPRRIDAGFELWPADGTALMTLAIQDRAMADLRRVGRNVAGYAIIEPRSNGRVAFLIAERILRTARLGRAEPSRVFGIVMTHELVHLLLGDHSHSRFGVMRPDWAAGDFRQNIGMFSAGQGEAIRSAVNRLTASQQIAD